MTRFFASRMSHYNFSRGFFLRFPSLAEPLGGALRLSLSALTRARMETSTTGDIARAEDYAFHQDTIVDLDALVRSVVLSEIARRFEVQGDCSFVLKEVTQSVAAKDALRCFPCSHAFFFGAIRLMYWIRSWTRRERSEMRVARCDRHGSSWIACLRWIELV
jgi:hypothetical protein